jgi:hypothetical protein
MNRLPKSDPEPHTAANLLEVLIRAGLILVLAIICYKVFSPFMIAMVWAVILAVTLYPLHQRMARRVGGRQGIASTLLLIVGFVLIAVPTAILVNSLGDSVSELIHKVQTNSLQIPALKLFLIAGLIERDTLICITPEQVTHSCCVWSRQQVSTNICRSDCVSFRLLVILALIVAAYGHFIDSRWPPELW